MRKENGAGFDFRRPDPYDPAIPSYPKRYTQDGEPFKVTRLPDDPRITAKRRATASSTKYRRDQAMRKFYGQKVDWKQPYCIRCKRIEMPWARQWRARGTGKLTYICVECCQTERSY